MKTAILAVLAALVLAATASAAKAAPSGTITADQPGDQTYGAQLTYTVTTGGLKGWQYPMVEVSCYQDLNGDNVVDTDLFGPDLAWVALDHPDATFTLGLGGGELDFSQPASCKATLYAYGFKGQQQYIVPLDSVEFDAGP